MLGWLARNDLSPIGLDIGGNGVRMIQLKGGGGRYSVAAAGAWQFPAEAAAMGLDKAARAELVMQGVRDIFKGGSFRGREVISCLRTDELAIKNVRLPHMSELDLAAAVNWECRERFGFEVAPDRVHFINAGEVRQGTEVRDEIILMAVTEQTITDHLALLSRMGLYPLHIDAEPAALFRAYQRFLRRAKDESAVSVVVDIGLSGSKVLIARGQTILMIKGIDLGGQRFNDSVSKELTLSYAEAAHLRKRVQQSAKPAGEPAEGAQTDQVAWSVQDAIRGQAEALAREISLCLRYCAVTFRGLRPTRVTLTGGEAYDSILVGLLGKGLDCECVVGEPLKGMDLGRASVDGDRRGVLTEWSVAVGLALRGLDNSVARKQEHEPSRISA